MLIDNNNIIHKELILSDNEYELTSLYGINESSLEKCLELVLEENKDVSFGMIQYSKKNKTLFFYADRKISFENWKKESSDNKDKELETTIEICEELKRILLSTRENETSCLSMYDRDDVISLYEVNKLLREKYKEYNDLVQIYKEKILKEYKRKTKRKNAHISISDLDYGEGKLRFSFVPSIHFFGRDYYEFYKENGDLIIRPIGLNFYHDKKLLPITGELFSELYDKLLEYKDYKKQGTLKLKTLNSAFLTEISTYDLMIYSPKQNFSIKSLFVYDKEKFETQNTSNNISKIIDQNESLIFSKLYVKIEDCPKWMHEILFKRRKEELEKNVTKQEQVLNSHKKIETKKLLLSIFKNPKKGE